MFVRLFQDRSDNLFALIQGFRWTTSKRSRDLQSHPVDSPQWPCSKSNDSRTKVFFPVPLELDLLEDPVLNMVSTDGKLDIAALSQFIIFFMLLSETGRTDLKHLDEELLIDNEDIESGPKRPLTPRTTNGKTRWSMSAAGKSPIQYESFRDMRRKR